MWLFYKEIYGMNDKFDLEEWYDKNIDLYKSLAANVANTLKTALDKDNIAYVDIPYRVKSKKSLLEKWKRPNKKYTNISEITDLAGIRVITLVEADLSKVEEIIKKLFNVHEEDSGDKNALLGNDKVGYRSKHYVCDIGSTRESLYELKHLKSKNFEIQTRTALAHAWAEIEHDRCYKLKGKLPNEIDRRLKLVAGLLESADNEFNRLTEEIEKYQETIQSQINNDNLNIELNSITLQEFITKEYSSFINKKENALENKKLINDVIYELNAFDIRNIQQLKEAIFKALNKYPEFRDTKLPLSMVDFIRIILALIDLDKIMFIISEHPYDNITCDPSAYQELLKYYNQEYVDNIFEKYNIEVV